MRPEIVVFTVAPEALPEAAWPRLAALLGPDERARANLFAFERHRHQHIAAHALKRLMLSAAAGAPPQSWAFETAPGGKPRLGLQPGPHFNLSHCDGLVACAVSPDAELGIDIEHLGREAPFSLAQDHYAPEERLWLDALPAAERQAGFYALWTLKEALIKATGGGLAQPLQDIAFGFEPLRVAFRDSALGDPRDWRFEQRRIGAGHLLALAWRGGEARVVIRTVRLEVLLERAAARAARLDDIVEAP